MNKKRVLVIDDEQVVLDSVERILSGDDYSIEGTTSSREGLEKGTTGDYDLVLTDIRMPEIGGMRILRDIKRSRPATPVMIITGYATVQSAVQAMKLGAADYIEKPFTPDQLAEAVEKAIDQAAAQEPEPQEIVHEDTVLEVLDRAENDSQFVADLLYHGADALSDYDLTGPEKLAILTGDIKWIEQHTGPLTTGRKKWLEQRLNAEIW